MRRSEALIGARGQIVWILALILSTSAIVYLERLEIGAPEKPVASPAMKDTDDALVLSASEALIAAEARLQAFPEDPGAAAALVLALAVAVQAGALDPTEGRTRAVAPRIQASRAIAEWPAVGVLAEITFDR
jgi:hypothetical protein